MKIGIVVVNYRSTTQIEARLGNQSLPRESVVVVVDNYSSDEEQLACRLMCEARGWAHISLASNFGFGAASNIGVDRAIALGAESIMLLNPDASIDEGAVALLLDHLQKRPESIVAPTILKEDRSVWFQGGRVSWKRGMAYHPDTPPATSKVEWLTGACIMMRVATWNALGGFDETYFLYWEDVELTYRWRVQGGELKVHEQAHAVHAVGGTQGAPGSSKSPTYVRYNLINRARFVRAFGSPLMRLWWACTLPLFWAQLWRGARGGVAPDSLIAYLAAFGGGSARGLALLLAPTRPRSRWVPSSRGPRSPAR